MFNEDPHSVEILEKERLEALYDYDILDTEEVKELDRITKFTAKIFKVPVGLITIIDSKRQWFKSHYGLDVKETPREIAFCDYTIRGDCVLQVKDARYDDRFKNNPLVIGDPKIRFYAGAPLISEQGYKFGALAIVDFKPKALNEEEIETLEMLAKQVINYFELRYKNKVLERKVEEKSAVLRDQVKDLKEKEKDLREINQDLDSFVYTASHDLKAPISNIEGLLTYLKEVMSSNCKGQEEVKEAIELMDKSVVKFRELVYDLTEVSHANKVKERHFQSNKFEDIFLDVIATISELIKINKAEFNIDFSQCEWIVFPVKDIRSIVYNLVSNAVKYRSPDRKPVISIKTEMQQEFIVLTVKDNGLGIPEAGIEKIFSMFKRFHTHVEGTGIGLYLVSKIVNSTGGKIEVYSKEGEGSEFKVFLKQ